MKNRGINPASPLLAIGLAIALLAAAGAFRMAPAKHPEMTRLVWQADSKMTVIRQCRLGQSIESVGNLCRNPQSVLTRHSHFGRVELDVYWPNDKHRFVGSFEQGRLVWATEQVSVSDRSTEANRTYFLNAENPTKPSAVTFENPLNGSKQADHSWFEQP